eukprot:403375863
MDTLNHNLVKNGTNPNFHISSLQKSQQQLSHPVNFQKISTQHKPQTQSLSTHTRYQTQLPNDLQNTLNSFSNATTTLMTHSNSNQQNPNFTYISGSTVPISQFNSNNTYGTHFTQCETGASMDMRQSLMQTQTHQQVSSPQPMPVQNSRNVQRFFPANSNTYPNIPINAHHHRPLSNMGLLPHSYNQVPLIQQTSNISSSSRAQTKHELTAHPMPLITNQTDLMSIRSSIDGSESENIGTNSNTATASLLEGSVGVHLPKSKICTAAARSVPFSKITTKNQISNIMAKQQLTRDIVEESENINNSDEERMHIATQRIEGNHQMRSTIIDKDLHQNDSSPDKDPQLEDSQDMSGSSSRQSYDPQNDSDGILTLLEGFVKKGELASIRQFQCLIKGEIQKALLYRAIEHKQVEMLKYLLTADKSLKLQQNLNLLHIACKQKDNSQPQAELEIIKTIMKYDKFADVNSQDTYGNTPLHLAAQNSKQLVLEFLLNKYNPNIYIKNSENQLALHSSTSQEILKKVKENLNKQETISNDTKNQLSSRSNKYKKKLLRNLSDQQLSSSKQPKNQQQLSMSNNTQKITRSRMPLKDISNYNDNSKLNSNLKNDSQLSGKIVSSQKSKIANSNTDQKLKLTKYISYDTEPAHKSKPSQDVQQYESIMDFCMRGRKQSQQNTNDQEKRYLLFREDEFEKVVEFTESDEEGSSQGVDHHKDMQEEYDDEDNMQFCEEIRELTDESFQKSIQLAQSKIGPKSFEPLSLLGQGSFGEVYLVRKKDTNELFAMKVLQKQKIMGQNLVKYAVTERNVLSYTRHPFIVGLNYAFQTRDKLFLILDYCPGGDLGKVITKERRLTEDRARIYLSEVLLALEDLHNRNIIFRDLKPDNVVLDEDGHALLTDFGLSKEGVLDNQASNSFCGSVAYLAPEMIRRSGHGKSVDWYLLGVLLYEMLVGIPPYFNQNREKLFLGIQKGPLMIPAQFTDEAKTLLIGLLSKNPMKRLGSGPRGAQEIKEHPFFQNINWEEVYNRKLSPPKPEKKDLKMLDLPYEKMLEVLKQSVYGDLVEDENRVAGWSFATSGNDPNIKTKILQSNGSKS